MRFLLFFLMLIPHVVLGNVTQAEFMDLVHRFEAKFVPVALEGGKKFAFDVDWESNELNAYAARFRRDYIFLTGGLARAKELDLDSLTLIICHEIGHLYGDDPSTWKTKIMNIEGEADYWAGKVCWQEMSGDELSENEKDENLEKAALNVMSYFARLQNKPVPELGKNDLSVVDLLLEGHPSFQCRLDTILAGRNNLQRPSCWYKD